MIENRAGTVFAVCFQTRKGAPCIWTTVEANDARLAVKSVMDEYSIYKVHGCYKEQPEWKWR